MAVHEKMPRIGSSVGRRFGVGNGLEKHLILGFIPGTQSTLRQAEK
ncbi:MAG: hypothetical protein Q7V31_11890 [Parvibaculum sp.]|nr:hypothetical protein [Parvibaculum sp.]MDO8839620.1 hypothetical protein [Parvibaculum sp.]